MKQIIYRGMTVEVEDWVNYVAIDEDSSIWGFEREPEYDHDYGEWLAVGGNYQGLERNCKQAEQSLEKV